MIEIRSFIIDAPNKLKLEDWNVLPECGCYWQHQEPTLQKPKHKGIWIALYHRIIGCPELEGTPKGH